MSFFFRHLHRVTNSKNRGINSWRFNLISRAEEKYVFNFEAVIKSKLEG